MKLLDEFVIGKLYEICSTLPDTIISINGEEVGITLLAKVRKLSLDKFRLTILVKSGKVWNIDFYANGSWYLKRIYTK